MSDKKWKRNRRRMSRKERKELAKCIWLEELADFDGADTTRPKQIGRLPTGPSPLERQYGMRSVIDSGRLTDGADVRKENA